jgi:hypothetical protein
MKVRELFVVGVDVPAKAVRALKSVEFQERADAQNPEIVERSSSPCPERPN